MAWSKDGRTYIPSTYRFEYPPERLGEPLHAFSRPGGESLPNEFVRALERLEQMPSALDTGADTPCALCGAPVSASGAVMDGPWRRHPGCRLDAHSALQGVLSAHPKLVRGKVILDSTDAALLLENGYLLGMSFATSETMPRTPQYRQDERPPKPFSWVSKDALAHLALGIGKLGEMRAKAHLVEHRSTQGPCCWCGRTLSHSWHARGHHWRSGEDAPLCRDCTTVYDRYSRTHWASDWDSQRNGMSESATGCQVPLGEQAPDGLRAFAEIADDDERNGHDEAWSHLDQQALREYKLDVWGRFPKCCPPEHKVEAVARWQRKAKLREMRRTAAARAESERQQTYRF